MAANADPGCCREGMRLVTCEARVMAGRLRTRRFLVAGRACLLSGGCRFVRAVTIEAFFASSVPSVQQRALLVTVGARLGRDRRSLVGMMARCALHSTVRRNRGHRVLRLGVTSNARRGRRSRRERVTSKAFRLALASRVSVLRLLAVTTRAYGDAGFDEAGGCDVVTTGAGDRVLANVLLVPRARPVLLPRNGYELRRSVDGTMRDGADQPRDEGDGDRNDERRAE